MPSPRKQLSKRVRFNVFKRDGYTCRYCGKRPPDVVLHCDHLIPVAEGGSYEMANLVTACADCNLGKAAVPLDELPPTLDAEAMLASIQDARELAVLYQASLEAERAYAGVLEQARDYLFGMWMDYGLPASDPAEMELSIHTFLSYGLLPAELGELMRDIAGREAIYRMSERKAWKYFCGAAWRRVDEKQAAGDDESFEAA